MESVIKQTYNIILSCDNKYNIHTIPTFKNCVKSHVRNVIKKSIHFVKQHPYENRLCKKYIMDLVLISLHECAYTHSSQTYINDVIDCISHNIKDLISTAVDALSLSIQLSLMKKE